MSGFGSGSAPVTSVELGEPIPEPTTPTPVAGGDVRVESVPGLILTKPVDPSLATAQTTTPFVRVYGLGAVLNGTDQERDRKLTECRDSIDAAIEVAQKVSAEQRNRTPAPEYSFHGGSPILIVKATAGQHQVIEQVIKALKENETAHSAPKKP